MDLSRIVSPELPAVVFVNPVAGGGRATQYLPRVRRVFEIRGLPVEFIPTKSAKELECCARDEIASGCKLLLAMGGDGTFQALANAAFESGVLLGILPAGGGNDLAAALGLPGNPVQAAEELFHGQPRPVDLVRLRAANGKTRLYVGGGGIGLDAEATRHASGKFSFLPGRLRYVSAALWALLTYAPPLVRAEFPKLEQPTIEIKSLVTAVLNTPTYGAGLRLAPHAFIDDGVVEVVFVGDLNLFEVFRLIPRLLLTGELRTTKISRTRAERLHLIANPESEFHGDGEILGMTPVEIEVVRNAVNVLAPKQTT